MNLEEKVKKKEIIKNKNNSNGLKDSEDIIEEMKYKYRILNKYIKLEDLKNKEKKLRFQDDLASDTTEKPAFLFMRNESKNSIGIIIKNPKYFSLQNKSLKEPLIIFKDMSKSKFLF